MCTYLSSDERERDFLTYAEYPGAKSILNISLCVQLTLTSGVDNSYLALLPHSAPLSLLYNIIHSSTHMITCTHNQTRMHDTHTHTRTHTVRMTNTPVVLGM